MTIKKTLGIAAVVVTTFVAVITAFYGYYRYQFPYGSDHRCNKILYFALLEYAEQHDGAFPAGEATPEVSISLIHTLDDYSSCGYLLHRRDVAAERVDDMLKQGKLLSSETCGWNYVEGLRSDSNRELALFWDKEGLTEIGMRLPEGGHWVTFVDGNIETISESQWEEFMANQKKLLAEEMAKRQTK
jgi:hypothetical protein